MEHRQYTHMEDTQSAVLVRLYGEVAVPFILMMPSTPERLDSLLETMREVVEVLPRHPVLSCYDGKTVRVELVRNGFEDWTLRVNLAVAYSINDVSTATTKQGTVVSVHEWAIPLEDELIKMWYFTVKGCGYVYFGVARNIQEPPDQRYVIAIPAANVKIQQ